jgi:soluble lytic murein transglycosylase-like protein
MLFKTLALASLIFVGILNLPHNSKKVTSYKDSSVALAARAEPSTSPVASVAHAPSTEPTPEPVVQTPVATPRPLYSTGVEQWRPLVQEYFGNETNYALAIIRCESGGNTYATGYNSDGSVDRGVFQVNSVHSAAVGGNLSALYDPATNVRVAKQIRDNSGWGAWTCSRKI